MICCGTSPLRCSAKLSWVRTATELMVGLRAPLDPGEPLRGEGGQRQAWGIHPGARAANDGATSLAGAPGFLRQHGQCEGPPRLQPGDGMENRLPAQDGADAGYGRQVQHRTPGAAETMSEPPPHMAPPAPATGPPQGLC